MPSIFAEAKTIPKLVFEILTASGALQPVCPIGRRIENRYSSPSRTAIPRKPSLATPTRPRRASPMSSRSEFGFFALIGCEESMFIVASASCRLERAIQPGQFGRLGVVAAAVVLEGTVLDHFGVNAAVARPVDLLEEDAVEHGTDLRTRPVDVNLQARFGNSHSGQTKGRRDPDAKKEETRPRRKVLFVADCVSNGTIRASISRWVCMTILLLMG